MTGIPLMSSQSRNIDSSFRTETAQSIGKVSLHQRTRTAVRRAKLSIVKDSRQYQ